MAKKDLSEIILGEVKKPAPEASALSTLPLDRIQLRETNTRELQQQHVAALAESIAVLGLLEPLVVDQGGRLLAGGHRLAAIKLLKDFNRTAYDNHFPGELVPVRTMEFDAVKDAERAWAIEIAENEQRRDYTPAEVRVLAERLRDAGYVDRRGRPAQGERPLRPQLEVIVGKSIRQLYRYLNEGEKLNRTDVRFNKNSDVKLHLEQAKTALEQWSNAPESKQQTKAASRLAKQLPQFLELLEAAIRESSAQRK